MKSVREKIRQNLERPISDKCNIQYTAWNAVKYEIMDIIRRGGYWRVELVNPIEDRINEVRKQTN